MTTTLAQLLQSVTQTQAFQTLLSYYQAAGFPTTAWESGDIDLTRLLAFSTAIADYATNYIPAIAGGSLLDYAPNYPGWTALTAQEIYNLTQNAATYTQGNILATNSSTTPYVFTAGQLIFVFSSTGNRYTCTGSGTIPASGSLSIPVQAENPGASYADASNVGSAALTLVTPLPGVTLNNPAGNYSSQTHVGSGTGTLTLGGSPVGAHSIVINVTSTGQVGTASFSYNLDGATAVSLGIVSSVTNLGGVGVNITFNPGASGTSFVNGDTYSFSTPGSWITSQGANTETDTALATRCQNRWASLSAVPTQSLYQLLATSTPSVGAQVTQCTVVPDATINNKINIIVSGPGGVLPGSTISAIQAYITPRARGTDNPVVQSPTTTAITIAASVTVSVSQLSTAQNAITTALNNYIANAGVNPTLRLAVITDLIMNVAGVIDCASVTINGSASNLTLGSSTTFVLPAYPPTLNLTYSTV